MTGRTLILFTTRRMVQPDRQAPLVGMGLETSAEGRRTASIEAKQAKPPSPNNETPDLGPLTDTQTAFTDQTGHALFP